MVHEQPPYNLVTRDFDWYINLQEN